MFTEFFHRKLEMGFSRFEIGRTINQLIPALVDYLTQINGPVIDQMHSREVAQGLINHIALTRLHGDGSGTAVSHMTLSRIVDSRKNTPVLFSAYKGMATLIIIGHPFEYYQKNIRKILDDMVLTMVTGSTFDLQKHLVVKA